LKRIRQTLHEAHVTRHHDVVLRDPRSRGTKEVLVGGLQHARTVRDTGRVRVGEERDGGERIDVVGCRNKTRR